MATSPPTPKGFAQSFQELFRTSAEEKISIPEKGTEVGIHWSRPPGIGKSNGASNGKERDTEWTAIMAIFLSRLARRLGFYQEWEYGESKIDHAWFDDGPWRDATDSRSPAILIEHENDVKGIVGSELPKLIESKCSLKVLITYEWNDTKAEGIQAEVGQVLEKNPDMEGDFLLIIGIDDVAEWDDWRFLHWDKAKQAMEELLREDDK